MYSSYCITVVPCTNAAGSIARCLQGIVEPEKEWAICLHFSHWGWLTCSREYVYVTALLAPSWSSWILRLSCDNFQNFLHGMFVALCFCLFSASFPFSIESTLHMSLNLELKCLYSLLHVLDWYYRLDYKQTQYALNVLLWSSLILTQVSNTFNNEVGALFFTSFKSWNYH